MAVTVADVAERLDVVRDRIRAAGGTDVRVLAVTKGFGHDAVAAAMASGLLELGENYAQELVAKAIEVVAPVPPTWHLIGRLQRNKVRMLSPYVSVWESVDRADLADEIAKRCPGARVLIQINLSGEPQKGGCAFDAVPALVSHASDRGLAVEGLMGVAPAGEPESARPGFRALVEMADELHLPERSIGMSSDLEVAVQEGATLVRVGRGLFGPRPASR